MKRVLIPFIVMAALGASPAGLNAQTATVGISADSVLVGEPFFFTVTVRADPGQTIVFPTLSDGSLSIGDTEFIRRVSPSGEPSAVDSATYRVAVFGVDSALVGGLPIGIVQATGDTLLFSSPTIEVGIHSVVPDSAQAMMDLAPLATFPLTLWPWIVGTILALVFAWWLIGYLKKRRSQAPVESLKVAATVDPYDEAVNRLRALAESPLRGEENAQMYHDELSDILRTYIERTLAVPALERTTGELIRALRQLSAVASDYVSEEAVARVNETLGISDLVKFAKYDSVDEENQRALDLARESIEDIEGGRRRRMAAAEAEAEQP